MTTRHPPLYPGELAIYQALSANACEGYSWNLHRTDLGLSSIEMPELCNLSSVDDWVDASEEFRQHLTSRVPSFEYFRTVETFDDARRFLRYAAGRLSELSSEEKTR